ncbi:insoluble matrix shell protein 3-like [Ruditapes philippinarum]|uniref:insoluble matrix shell protein 3-like n=1 Tax=Ruditapes philippinarum TaxID=129788 RepID=UPI00295A78F7|nr:insoluble matrix shell protein 3-like [Ruditapes philippinarum]
MLLAVTLLALIVPWTVVEGRGCWADTNSPGIPCQYGYDYPVGNEQGLEYSVTSLFSYTCCDALSCRANPNKCEFVHVGCGQSINAVPLKSKALHWELPGVEPIMRCFDQGSNKGAYYSYTVKLVPID